MANHWCRLWHEMPNDPKWRTIARAAKQPMSLVLSTFLHLMVSASANAAERGRTQVNAEDIASALDVETEAIEAVLKAMEGRVIEGGCLSGWEGRQPEREDGSAERSKAWRERKKLENAHRTQPNAIERGRTQDKEENKNINTSPSRAEEDSSPVTPGAKPDSAPECNGIPGDLDSLAYARGLLDTCNLPHSIHLQQAIANGIDCYSRENAIARNVATSQLIQLVQNAVARGETVNRFWFEDAKYRRRADTASARSHPMQSEASVGMNTASRERDWAMDAERLADSTGYFSTSPLEVLEIAERRGLFKTVPDSEINAIRKSTLEGLQHVFALRAKIADRGNHPGHAVTA